MQLPDEWNATHVKRKMKADSVHRKKLKTVDVKKNKSLEDLSIDICREINSVQNPKDFDSLINFDSVLSSVPYKDILENIFGGTKANLKNIPIITRAYEESFMREPLNRSERHCVMGSNCECMKINSQNPFVGVEFLLQNEETIGPHMCVLCSRKTTQKLFYDLVYTRSGCNIGHIQRYGVLVNVAGEYKSDYCLIMPPQGDVQCMPYPSVAHCRNNYTVETRRGDVPQDKGLTLPELQASVHKEPGLQALIDCHLLSSYYNNDLFRLDVSNTYHYHHLPDLTMYLRQSLVESDGANKSVLGMGIGLFCVQGKLKRIVQQPPFHVQKALVNLVHALLLGLYPYNVQQCKFALRCEIAGKLRETLCRSQDSFLSDYENLTVLSILEYFNNVVPDFCPVEHGLLVKNTNVRMIINQVCDNFRLHMHSASFSELNGAAADALGSVQRYLKQFHVKISRQRTGGVSKHKSAAISTSVLQSILRIPFIPQCTQLSMINSLQPMPLHDLCSVEYVWQNVNVYLLPQNCYDEQVRALTRIAASERWKSILSSIHVCIPCALSQKKDVLQQKSTFDCVERRVFCQRCQGEKVRVNLLGRILRVRNDSYILCDSCLTPRIWGTTCKACSVPPPTPQASCCGVCHNKHIVFTKRIVNIESLRVDFVHLCCKHAKHTIRSQATLYDFDMLVADALAK